MLNPIKGGRGFEISVPKGSSGGDLQAQILSLKAAAQEKYGPALSNFEFRLVSRGDQNYLQIKEQTWFGGFKERHNFGTAQRTTQREGAVNVLKSVYGETVSTILASTSKAQNKTIDQTSARALVRDIGLPAQLNAPEELIEPAVIGPSGEAPLILESQAQPEPERFDPTQGFSTLPKGNFVLGASIDVFKAPETIVIADLPPIIVEEQALPAEKNLAFDKLDVAAGKARRGSVAIAGSAKGDIPITNTEKNVSSAAIIKAQQDAKQQIENNSYEAKIRLAAAGGETPERALEVLDKRAKFASYLGPEDVMDMSANLVGPRQWGKEIASIGIDSLKGLDLSKDDDEQIEAYSDLLLYKSVHLVGETSEHHPAHDAFVNFKAKAENYVIRSDEGYAKSLKLLNIMTATDLTSPDVIDVFDRHEDYLAVEAGSDQRAELEVAIGRAFADNATDRDLELIDRYFPRPPQG